MGEILEKGMMIGFGLILFISFFSILQPFIGYLFNINEENNSVLEEIGFHIKTGIETVILTNTSYSYHGLEVSSPIFIDYKYITNGKWEITLRNTNQSFTVYVSINKTLFFTNTTFWGNGTLEIVPHYKLIEITFWRI